MKEVRWRCEEERWWEYQEDVEDGAAGKRKIGGEAGRSAVGAPGTDEEEKKRKSSDKI